MLRRIVHGALALAAGAALSLLTSQPALAWGEQGHRAVAEIAQANVSPKTATVIAALLKAEPGLGTPTCAVRSLSDASYWPDCIRNQNWRWAYTFPWHFVDSPVSAPAFDPKAQCDYGACVTAQIERNRRILADASLPAAQRLEALAFLAHFVGDIHQPLHAADNGDHGGNTPIVANLPGEPIVNAGVVIDPKPHPISLHWFWDTIVVRRLFAEEARTAIVRPYSAEERKMIATGAVDDWARESWELARGLVYPQAFGKVPTAAEEASEVTIPDAEIGRDAKVARQRLIQAGLRLARLLDEALGQ